MINYITAGLVLCWFLFISYRAFSFARQTTNKTSLYGILFISVVYIFLLIIDWPGIVSLDDVFILPTLSMDFYLLPWHSHSYIMLGKSMQLLTGGPFGISLFNLIFFINLVVIIFSLVDWKKQNWLFWVLIIILLFPQAQSLVLFQNKDSTYSILLLNFIFGLIYFKTQENKVFKVQIWELVLLGVILVEMRQEGAFLLLLLPMLMYYFCFSKKIFFKTMMAACLSLGILTTSVLVWKLSTLKINSTYRSTAIVNPLSYIIHIRGLEILSDEQKKAIDGFIDINHLVNFYSLYEIDPVHKGGFRHYGGAGHEEFEKASFQIILQNMDLYLANRWLMFLRLFNIEEDHGRLMGLVDDYTRQPLKNDVMEKMLKDIEYEPKPAKRNLLQDVAHTLRVKFYTSTKIGTQFLFRSGIIPIIGLLIIMVVFIFKEEKYISLIAGIFLLRALIITLLTPAPYFKYVVSIWLGGWLLILFVLYDYKKHFLSTGK